MFPFCKTIKITTTTATSSEILSAEIPAADFFSRGQDADVGDLPVKGVVYEEPSRVAEHFTEIQLMGLTDAARNSISPLKPKRTSARSSSIFDWAPLDRLRWELQDELPLPFSGTSPYKDCFDYPEAQMVQVFFNGSELFRNDVEGDLLTEGGFDIEGIKCRYPLFQSKRYGDIFKKICILLLAAKVRSSDPRSMQRFFLEELETLFQDYL